MAGAKRKCKICGEWIEDKNDSVKYKTGYAHTKCFNIAMKAVVDVKKSNLTQMKKTTKKTVRPQKELKEDLSEEEFKDKKRLCDYIRELIKEDISVATYHLMEEYKKKYKITYKEMYDDLYWYFNICNHEVEGEKVIAMVPWCHTDAQKYYASIEKSNASCQKHLKELPNMYKETIALVSKKREKREENIDISTIGENNMTEVEMNNGK